ncbi:hypothetical protein [Spiroplasma cantharicola]|uniref:Uncharacterized protein n=1 Tax=Spiroplasma cantharicola TaxID=362837 RepID=A0A0M4KCI9_9MOLU|nr:hypothetical protein [Spiroplasma cantharicola]ALD66440.1 hypothetical protein SCANT_v1c05340 [Spiroplasma cantharicola]
MSGIVPKFCPTHLKIHTCELQNVFNKNKVIHEGLNAKIRRMHGIQTEEEIAQSNLKQKDAPGSIGDILSKAKVRIEEEKEKIAKLPHNEEPETKVVNNDEINDRIANLKAKMAENNQSPSNTSSDLQTVIENAQNYQSNHPETQYEAPKRANQGKTNGRILPRANRPHITSKSADLVANNTTKSAKIKQTSIKKDIDERMFTQEETQELIQLAVKEALKQVGLIKNDKIKKKPTTKKLTNKTKTSTVAKKATNKKVSTKTKESAIVKKQSNKKPTVTKKVISKKNK